MRKIRIAQIGLNINSHSGEIFDTLKAHPEIFEIVGYALVEDERVTCAHKTARFQGYKELTLDEILNDTTIEAVAELERKGFRAAIMDAMDACARRSREMSEE